MRKSARPFKQNEIPLKIHVNSTKCEDPASQQQFSVRYRSSLSPPGANMALAFDEMTGSNGQVRPAYAGLDQWLRDLSPDVLDRRRREAELLFRRIGITFAVYGEAAST